ncbi:MAG: haloacid dehalogenase-like hydrolase [Cyclobacteriaceae bacterium]|nr:haloacid dehalogenase-like hydrolase [Cyclobacteriaceae bacterium]
MKTLLLFDFDGTLTKEDTLFTFTKYYHGAFKFALGIMILSPILILHIFKIIPNQKAKEFFLTFFFKNVDIELFNKRGGNFSSVIETIIRPKAQIELSKHKALGDQITIVTASPENWVKPWCDLNGFHCIGTKLEVIDGRITGKIAGLNCFGAEKKNRIKSEFDLSLFDEIVAFGDSVGDLEMLNLAHRKFYKPFRK